MTGIGRSECERTGGGGRNTNNMRGRGFINTCMSGKLYLQDFLAALASHSLHLIDVSCGEIVLGGGSV